MGFERQLVAAYEKNTWLNRMVLLCGRTIKTLIGRGDFMRSKN
jgi:hypothetical protein